MSGILPSKKACQLDCPGGYHDHTYMDRGELIRCEHGALFIVAVGYVRYGDEGWQGNYLRLSRFWTPRLYRRAIALIESGGEFVDHLKDDLPGGTP